MRKTHKQIPMSQEEQRLCIAVVSKITRRMESKAAQVGYNIDNDEHWIVAHDIIDVAFHHTRGQNIACGIHVSAEIITALELRIINRCVAIKIDDIGVIE